MFRSLMTGIDIDSGSVRAAVIYHHKGESVIRHCFEVKSSRPLISDDGKLNHLHIKTTLKQLKKQLPLMVRQAAINIPESLVIHQEVEVQPNLTPVEEEPVIMYQFSLLSPLPTEELSIDYVKVEAENTIKPLSCRVLVYAVRESDLEVRQQLLKEAGLKLVYLQSSEVTDLAGEADRRVCNKAEEEFVPAVRVALQAVRWVKEKYVV